MRGLDFQQKEKNIKNFVIILLTAIALASTYYFHFVLHTSVLFTHFYYIPIILACIWWDRKGMIVAVLLSVNLLALHFIFHTHQIEDTNDILRSIMFIVIAVMIIGLREKSIQAEVERHLAQEKVDQIFRTTGDGLCVIDTDFNIKQYNREFLNLLRINEHEVKSKKCYQLLKGSLCDTPNCVLMQILSGKDHIEFDLEKVFEDGREMFCIISATPIKGLDGKTIGIIENLKDITARKLAEQALVESEKRYKSFVKNFKGIAYQVDTEFKPLFFHGAVQVITGYSEEELIAGTPKWTDIVHADDLHEIYRISRKLSKIPNYSCEREYRIVCKNGEIKWVEEITHNICDKDGRPFMIQAILYDITERKETEDALQKSEERLLHSQKMEAVGRLAGGIAHDFNNLITIITGNSDLLLDEIDEENPLREDLEEIYKAGERASSLTRQLLAFSRRQMLQPKIVDLNTIVGDMQRLLKRLIGEDIELVTLLEPNLSHVKADPGQIEQVLLNLIVNARDAMPHGGALTIRTESVLIDEENSGANPEIRAGKFACLSVEDTGVGIDKETLNKIFEPFFSTKAQGEGTGLGLSTVYGIIKQHDGFTTVYSEVGQGSIFKIYLPAISVKQEGDFIKSGDLEKYQGNGERILLVEDEDGVRRFAKKILDRSGYTVFEAPNAHEALAIFEREERDFYLILSDVVLPDINGVQLVDKLISMNPKVQVILCSGYSDQRSQWRVICDRNFRFLKKPYNKYDLLKAIDEAKKEVV